MPKELAALLVEEGAVPADLVERAVSRQREAGGALDTALLEERAIGEAELVGYLARAAELPAAPETAWSGNDARARRVFPSRVAERHGLAPFALEGRELSLVATYPVDVGLLDEISFMLSLHLTAHVGPEWRVRELIQRLYGGQLSPRLAALAVASGAAPPPAGAAAPEAAGPAPRPPPPASAGFARDESEPLEPLAAALAQALEAFFDDMEIAVDDAVPGRVAGEEPEGGDGASEPPPVLDRTAPPHWTLEDARAALASARHRDEVVLVALRYARDFFEYAAMFAVTHDAVAGHDALGMEEARDRVRTVAIWSSDPGIFKTVIDTQSPYLGPVAAGVAGTDAVLHGLGRAPRTVLVYPVLLRDRPVVILYADNGEAPVAARRLGDLLLFLSTVGPSFERIIRDRKRQRPRRSPSRVTPAAPLESSAVPPASGEGSPTGRKPSAERADPGQGAEEARAGPGPIEEPSAAEESREPAAAPEPAPAATESPPPRVADSFAALEEQFFGETLEEQGPRVDEAEPRAEEEPPPAPAPQSAAPSRPPAPTPAAPPPVAKPPEPATLVALADRALESDPVAAAAACAALENRRRDPSVRPAAEKLRRALLSGISGRASRAARAIGALRDVEAVPLLIQVLETSEPETAQEAAGALAGITLQRLGPDARRWLAWWKENRGRGRAEWLFSGLSSPDRDTRVAASVELSLAAPPPVAYSADMPAAEREKAARAWAGWWSRSGHIL